MNQEELLQAASTHFVELTNDITCNEKDEPLYRLAILSGAKFYKAGVLWTAERLSLDNYTDAELRAEISRRIAERKAAKASVNRCRMCKHFGAIDYCGHDTSGLPPRYSCPCKFFKTKNGKYYRVHQPSQPACEHFERKE